MLRSGAGFLLFRRQRVGVLDDQRAGAFIGEDLQQQAVADLVGNQVHARHAATHRRFDGARLGQHALGE